MGKVDRIVRAVYGSVWAIEPEKLDAILDFLDLRAEGVVFTAEEVQARIGDRRTASRGNDQTAVLPLFGVIGHRMGSMSEISGGTSTEGFAQAFDQAVADPKVSRIVIDVDSPGGSVTGVDELTSRIYNARGEKPIVAIANGTAASAAYWIASAADELVMIPSGRVGSIGVFAVHTDRSEADAQAGLKRTIVKAGRFKAEGNPYEPLSEAGTEALQDEVDDVYGAFVEAVARNRGVTTAKVREGFGEGRTVTAKKARAEGMVDRIATLEDVLAVRSVMQPTSRSRAALADIEIAGVRKVA